MKLTSQGAFLLTLMMNRLTDEALIAETPRGVLTIKNKQQ